MKKLTFGTAIIFSLMIFFTLLFTTFLNVLLTVVLLRTGIWETESRELTLLVFAVVSIIIGMIFARHFSRRPIETIVEICNATQEIARGNFHVQLSEDISVTEIRTMAQNFNLMARELASIEILRNDFIENVSHEFKTPLSAIEGYVTLLQRKGLPEEKQAEYIHRILFSTRRLSALTGNILLLSRLENQEIAVTKESFSLDEQLREVILMYEPQWADKQLDMDVDLDPVNCTGNRELLAQVWQNLLGNAIKFVHPSGQVRVLLRRKEDRIEVSVVDNGPGMSEEVLGRIYEKFYQGDPSRASAGNGLGLTLAKRIVDLHGGTISASSKEGKGTAITVLLPME